MLAWIPSGLVHTSQRLGLYSTPTQEAMLKHSDWQASRLLTDTTWVCLCLGTPQNGGPPFGLYKIQIHLFGWT